MRSRWLTAVKSLENVLPTCCVGESGVTSSGCSSSMASSSRHSSSNWPSDSDRRIEHVVAEPVARDLLGQPGVPLTDGFWAHGGEATEPDRHFSSSTRG